MTVWNTEPMELGNNNPVIFQLTSEDSSNFFVGNHLPVTIIDQTNNEKVTLNRLIRYSRAQGLHFMWRGYAICYEDFVNGEDVS